MESIARENETLTSEMDAILVENAQLREQMENETLTSEMDALLVENAQLREQVDDAADRAESFRAKGGTPRGYASPPPAAPRRARPITYPEGRLGATCEARPITYPEGRLFQPDQGCF
ncbi:hypothetical protein T484DRAFT_1764419 [Baffinella frigidus]|nr:hypothetical protein T484DRAFT_1764419 [Cryptophyta sp. CCMP2293]